jgi:hypothetical protein
MLIEQGWHELSPPRRLATMLDREDRQKMVAHETWRERQMPAEER